MSWRVLPLKKSLGEYRQIWDGLNDELYASNPYFSSCFVEPLLKNFATGHERICIHGRDDEITGLVIVTPARFGKWSLFTPAQAQIVPLLVRHPESLQTLVASLPGFVLGLEMLCQDPLYGPALESMRGAMDAPLLHAHTMGIALDGGFNDYWAARSSNLRGNLGRRIRRVQDAGMVIRLERISSPTEMRAAVARFGEMESAGWKGRNGTAIHVDNEQGVFYAEVMECFAARDQAAIYELYFNERLVSMQMCISSPTMTVLLKTAYDEEHSSYSPGRILLHALIAEEFAAKRVRTLEFYTNADSDQLAWATHDRWIKHYLLLSNRFVKAGYQLSKWLRQRLRGRAVDTGMK